MHRSSRRVIPSPALQLAQANSAICGRLDAATSNNCDELRQTYNGQEKQILEYCI